MAVLEDPNTGSMAAVDASKSALRASLRPFELTGYFAFGAQSGALTGVAANGPVFSLRNAAGNGELALVRHIGLGFLTTTAFTTPQAVDYGLLFARSFTASDTGGTAVSITGNNAKVRTSLAAPNSLDARIAAAAALTAGTRTLDTNALAQLGAWSGGAGQGLVPVQNNLWDQYTGDQLIVLAPNEGLIVANLTAMGAAGVVRLYVNIEFAIATAFCNRGLGHTAAWLTGLRIAVPADTGNTQRSLCGASRNGRSIRPIENIEHGARRRSIADAF